MGNPKRQHYISKCYLKQFADPDNSGNEPRIWIFSKDGKTRELKKVEKAFISKHIYSFKAKSTDAIYDYSLEISLSLLEDKFATLFQNKISQRKPLSNEDHVILCAFIAAMLLRTKSKKESLEETLNQIITITEQMEQSHNIPPKRSIKLREYQKDAHKLTLANLLPEITDMLIQMNLAFLCAKKGSKAKFITSDDPCNLFNPDLQWQHFYGYGLGQKNIQLTIPLSTDIEACFCWNDLRGYIKIPDKRIQDINRMTRGMCHSFFVTSSPILKRLWFSRYPLDIIFIFKRVLPNRLKKLAQSIRMRLYDR